MPIRLLVDTDIFCSLSIAGLFDDALAGIGIDPPGCARLAALPYMLKRGRLRRKYGPENCDRLLPLANSLPIAKAASAEWLDLLNHGNEIDPGEAQLFALAAEEERLVTTGDKRALLSLKGISEVQARLNHKIVSLEAILIRLCDLHGEESIRTRVTPLIAHEIKVKVCFSGGNPSPLDGLVSYHRSLCAELAVAAKEVVHPG